MKKLLFLLLIFIYCIEAEAYTISGFVYDANSGEKLIGAYVYDSSSQRGTISNEYGYFSLGIGTYANVRVSYLGYNSFEKIFNIDKDIFVDFSLQIESVQLQEFKLSSQQKIEERAEMSTISIPMKQLKQLPMLAGELDIVKALQLLPGVQSGHEGQSKMYVRGGSHDQNLLLLDDVPIYNINHLGGFVSVFNPESINSFNMYKGAFPARYGGRLSSVLDVRMKDGNMKERHTTATLGILSCKIQTEGPIIKDTASYMISARRFMYDLITKPIGWIMNNKQSSGYTFYDLNAKFNYKPSSKDRLLLSFYHGNDKSSATKKEKEKYSKTSFDNKAKWGNTLLALRWNRVLSKDLFANVTMSYSQYRYKSTVEYKYTDDYDEDFKNEYSFYSKINDIALKYDFSYFPFKNYSLRAGGQHINHDFRPNGTVTYQTGSDFNEKNITKYHSWENTAYLENNINLSNIFKANIGLRAVAYSTENKTYANLEPRAFVSINIPYVFALKASVSKMCQYSHMLTYDGQGLPTDIWLPVTKDIPPQQATIFSVGLSRSIIQGLEFSTELFHKKMNNLVDYKEGAGLMGNNFDNWSEIIETGGNGTSEGIEFLLQKNEGRVNGWVAYTLSESNRQFDNINKGKVFPYIYDTRHNFSIACNYDINKNITLSATWQYMTGRAMNFFNTIYEVGIYDDSDMYLWGVGINAKKNSIRMHPYHRLDLGFTYRKVKKQSERIINVGIYNVYNRANPYYYYADWKDITDANGKPTGQSKRVIIQRSMFMFMPSISYTWAW